MANLTRKRKLYVGIVATWVVIIAFTESISAHGFAFITSDFVSVPGQFAVNHGASIVELTEGHLIVCWYAGSEEKAADGQIYCSRRYGPTNAWTAPQAVVRSGKTASNGWLSNGALGNTALHLTEEGRLWLFYTATTVFRGWSATHVAYKASTDQGKSWSKQGTKITASIPISGAPRSSTWRLIKRGLESGEIPAPVTKQMNNALKAFVSNKPSVVSLLRLLAFFA